MKAIKTTILAAMLVIGARSAYARCTDADREACACPVRSQNTLECREADQVNVEATASQAATSQEQTMTTATAMGEAVGCAAGNSTGRSTCSVVFYFLSLTDELVGGVQCDVTVEMDGWGSTSVTDVDCGFLYPAPHNNGSCTGGGCG